MLYPSRSQEGEGGKPVTSSTRRARDGVSGSKYEDPSTGARDSSLNSSQALPKRAPPKRQHISKWSKIADVWTALCSRH